MITHIYASEKCSLYRYIFILTDTSLNDLKCDKKNQTKIQHLSKFRIKLEDFEIIKNVKKGS